MTMERGVNMKAKKSKPILSTADKQILAQNKVKKAIVILLCLSIILNVIYIVDLKVPVLNPDGVPAKLIAIDRGVKSKNVLKRIIKDNTKYESFSSITLETQDGIYHFGKQDQVAYLYSSEGWDFEYCDFELAKWDELKELVLKYQLSEYDPNSHVDKEGRIQNYDEEYAVELRVNGELLKMEIPENVDEIEDYLIELTELARTK